MATIKTHEVELKLLLSSKSYTGLRRELGEYRMLLNQKNTFFEDSEGVLASEKWALRIRQENEDVYVTVKGPSLRTPGGIFKREEYESKIPYFSYQRAQEGFCLEEVPAPPLDFLREKYGNMHVRPFLQFSNTREVYDWQGFSLEVDHSRCKDQELFELEVEGENQELVRGSALLESLFARHNWAFTPSTTGKFTWARNVAGVK